MYAIDTALKGVLPFAVLSLTLAFDPSITYHVGTPTKLQKKLSTNFL